MFRITVAVAARKFLEAVALEVSPATLALYRLYVNRFSRKHGRLSLEAVSPAIVRAWGITYHPVQAVQRMMSWCRLEARLLEVNPLEGMRKMPRGRRLRTLTAAESARLLRAAKPATRRLLVALRETFARPHELRIVTWNDVRTLGLRPAGGETLRQGGAFFFLRHFKGERTRRDPHAVRVIPISKRLGRLLARLQSIGVEGTSQIFLNCRHKAWTTNAVRCAFRHLQKSAGLELDPAGERVVAYTFRHTAATNAIVAGVPVVELAGAMGHSDIRMTYRYVHLSPTFLKGVMDRIDEAKREGKAKNRRPGSTRIDPDDAR